MPVPDDRESHGTLVGAREGACVPQELCLSVLALPLYPARVGDTEWCLVGRRVVVTSDVAQMTNIDS